MNNLNTWDRLIRALLGLVALEAAYFWLAGNGQLAAGVVGAMVWWWRGWRRQRAQQRRRY